MQTGGIFLNFLVLRPQGFALQVDLKMAEEGLTL
jgi:hypothetical protein